MHIGNRIEEIFRSQGRNVKWFAEKLCYDRRNIYKIFQKESIDTTLLKKISLLLNHNFFQNLAEEIENDSEQNGDKTRIS